MALSRVDRCRELYELLLPYEAQLGVTSSGSLCFGFVSTTLGLLASALGDARSAEAHLEHSMRRADAVGAPFEAVKSRRALAEAVLQGGGRWADVEAIVDESSSMARARGYLDEEAHLRQLRQQRGVRRGQPVAPDQFADDVRDAVLHQTGGTGS